MISVVLVGTGNVAQNIFEAFLENDEININQVIGRSYNSLKPFMDKTKISIDFESTIPADIYIIAVTDTAIPNVAAKLGSVKGLVVHTSGATPMSVLQNLSNFGVFYPLQTFTKGRTLNFKHIPICIEAKKDADLDLLKKIASSISANVQQINSKERSLLHVSAVFVNNFTNYLYQIGNEICDENQLDFKLLLPLIQETANKLNVLTPREAQTGPAKRGDQNTLHTHLTLLKNKQQRKLYTQMSNAIKMSYGEEL